jgi:hypothetical protein
VRSHGHRAVLVDEHQVDLFWENGSRLKGPPWAAERVCGFQTKSGKLDDACRNRLCGITSITAVLVD